MLEQGLYNVSALPRRNKSYAPKPSSPNVNGAATGTLQTYLQHQHTAPSLQPLPQSQPMDRPRRCAEDAYKIPWTIDSPEQKSITLHTLQDRAPTTAEVPPPPPPQHYDMWSAHLYPPTDGPGFDPFARHQPLRINDDESDSDGLEIPPANLRISSAPPTPAGPEPDIHLYPQL